MVVTYQAPLLASHFTINRQDQLGREGGGVPAPNRQHLQLPVTRAVPSCDGGSRIRAVLA